MSDVSARCLRSERCRSRVRKQIQHLRLASGSRQGPGARVDVFPVRRLLRENSHVLEGGETEPEAEFRSAGRTRVAYIPLVLAAPEPFPGAAVFLPRLAEAGPGAETGVREPVPFRCAQ